MSHTSAISGITELMNEQVSRNDKVWMYARQSMRPVWKHCYTDNFDLNFIYSWSEGDVDLDDDGPGVFVSISSLEIQPWKATLMGDYQVSENIDLNFQVIIVGDRNEAFDDGIDPFAIDGYTVVDAGAHFVLPVGELDVQLPTCLMALILLWPAKATRAIRCLLNG